mmetsp:Transcript_17777/g.30111  ORF Transcript_17777/g.30111 Transcript_17777/m.30111 type:complete len:406 (+) Transcript_17777:160-1377(+)
MVILLYMGVQALIGFIAVEYAWKVTERFRSVEEKRDGQFPQYRRTDVGKWAKWKFYPGAMLLMPTRVILLIIDAVFLTTVVQILSLGHDFKKGPMKAGCRKWLIYFMYYVSCTFFLLVAGVRTSLNHLENDYSYYLGEGYKANSSLKKIKRTSTIVSNHVSWLDPVVMLKNIRPAFAPSSEFQNVPLLGTLINCIDSIYIPRGGSEESKAKALAAIRERQELIEETGRYAPFLIFAEGGTTNGTGLINFKKGAFFAEKAVKPVYMKYSYNTVNPAFDTIQFLPLLILHMSWACFGCDVYIMSDFQPNEYLFETHADKGTERWEVYAWAVRDLMAKSGKFENCDQPLRQKFQYEQYMQMMPNSKLPQATSDIESGKIAGQNYHSLQNQDSPLAHRSAKSSSTCQSE